MARLAQFVLGTSFALFSVLYLIGCGGTETPDNMVDIRGMVTYREKIALSGAARLEVELHDVTKVGASSEMLGRTAVENVGQVPIGFVITLNATNFEQGHIYSVRGSIYDGNRVLFTTDKVYPVDLENLEGLLEIVMIKAD
jgi:uncharacterized lipoprotein YbaY